MPTRPIRSQSSWDLTPMTTEIIPLEERINAIAPLGLPNDYSIRLKHRSVGGTTYIDIDLYYSGAGRKSLVDSTHVTFSESTTKDFKVRVSFVRSAAVTLFNNYLASMTGEEILKSIEDRLNAGREMFVLTASPVAHEDR